MLHVDASGKGLGAVLLQYQEGDLRVISYGSRTLTLAEKKYHSPKLEVLEVKWAVCNQFKDYLYYAPHFHIYTDNNPVTYIISTGRLTATGQRWVNELAEFSFSLHYKSGKQDPIADTLSRTSEQTHLEHIQSCTETVPVEMVKALLDRSDLTQENQEPVAVCLNAAIKEQTYILDDLTTANTCFTIDDIKKEQKAKYWISRAKTILKQPTRLSPRYRRSESKEVQQLLPQEAKFFFSDDDVLYRQNKEQQQVVLPHALKEAVYREVPIKMAHLGADRTLQFIKESFYWPKIEGRVRHFINH